MKCPELINIELLSDTTFSSGRRSTGPVDIEIEHDEYGLPMLSGKTLHGLLRDGWLSMQEYFPDLRESGLRILGCPGDLTESSILRISDAAMDESVRRWAIHAIERKHSPHSSSAILNSLTDIRYQTSEERKTGAPAKATLRSVRVVLHNHNHNDNLCLKSRLFWLDKPSANDLRCLALCVLSVRNAGLSRNRGRGWLRLTLDGDLGLTHTLAKGVEF